MRWITGIKLNNYRAFGRAYAPIIIPANHHLLIYGENGSGKSSLYNAVKDFFSSSSDTAKTFDVNLFSQIAGNDTGAIELSISELNPNKTERSQTSYIFGKPDAQSTHRVPAIKLANKVKGFIDYRRLLQTHFVETKPGENPNLFKLIIEDLLADHLVKKTTGGGVADYELHSEWNRIRDGAENLDGRHNAHHTALQELPLFEIALKQLLIQVFTEFKRLIQTYFDKKLDINVTLSQMDFERDKWKIKKELFFEIKYAGQLITSYQTFINEARLSALGLCIYLAALKTYPPAAADLKVLYLDDVFIGLDSNNRIPLLNILKHEFIDQNFQIFLSTYDRHWFETARNWFGTEKCAIKCVELFINDDDGNPLTPDIPVIIDPSNTLFENAKKHFDAKDYPAAANYLRKTCEAELRRILPKHQTLKVNHNTDEVEKITKLETLIDNFFTFLSKNNLNEIPFRHFKTYKKIIFNPLSHDDTDAPHFKKEIQDGIALVTELLKIKTKEIILAKNSFLKPMKLGMRDNTTNVMHNYEIRVLENLQIVQQDASPVKFSVVECEVSEGAIKRKFPSLKLAFDQLWNERGNAAPTDETAFHSNIKISTHRCLADLKIF